MAADLFTNIFRDGYPFDEPANLTAELTDFVPVFQPLEAITDQVVR